MSRILYQPVHGTRNIALTLLMILPRLARQTLDAITLTRQKPLPAYWQPMRGMASPRYLTLVTKQMLSAHIQQTMAGGLDLQDMLDLVLDRPGLQQHVREVLSRAS